MGYYIITKFKKFKDIDIYVFIYELLFRQYREAAYQAQGVRWVYRGDHTAGIVNNMWDDLEPDQVTISMDQRFAYVSLPVSV